MMPDATSINLFTLLALFLAGAFMLLLVGIVVLIIAVRQRAKEGRKPAWNWKAGYIKNLPQRERILYSIAFASLVCVWGIVAISATTLWIISKLL